MTGTRLGPTAVDSASYTQEVQINDLWTKRDWLIQRHQEEKDRINTVTNVAVGEWYVEWPDLSRSPEAPSVANLVELGISHWSSVGGAILPSVRVPVGAAEERSQAKRGSRKRERRIRELWEQSNVSELATLWWGDYAGTGMAVLGAWANFHEKDKTKRNPYLQRYDPRHTYTLKDPLGNVTEMLVARKITRSELKAQYPDCEHMFSESHEGEIEEWFWYTQKEFLHIIVDTSKDGRKERYKTLAKAENKLGFVPVWEVTRPSFDGQKRGVFDQTIHLLRTMHRLMVLTIYSSEEHVFPAIASYDVANPEDIGPGATLMYRSAEGRIDRLGPTSHFDVKDLIARLREEAAQSAVYPQQLVGEPGASIASSRAIKSSMGALDARLAVAHKQFEVGLGKVSGFLLAMDETYCDGEKTIKGDHRDKRDAEKYLPSRDVAGSWDVKCTYGIGAGSDPANVETRLAMNLANGLISRETARQQLPFLEDPDAEPLHILREAMQDSFVAGVLAMAQQGDPSVAAEALKLLATSDTDVNEVVEKLIEFVKPPEQEQGMPGGDALAAGQAGESLARGGIPGQAEQGPPGQGLPPLSQLMGGPQIPNQVM